MSKDKQIRANIDAGETVHILARESQELLKQGNRRRIIAREPDGKVLLDISITQAVIATLLILLLLPVGWLILLLLVAYGMNKKARIDFVRELTEGDDNIIAAPKVKHNLSASDSAADSKYDTQVEEESVRAKRR